MEIHGNSKKLMEFDANLKKLMEIHWYFYKSIEIDRNSWEFTGRHGMEIDGNSWKFMRSLWKLMGIHGNFKKIWKFNEVFGN
jgi:hypothetical protein